MKASQIFTMFFLGLLTLGTTVLAQTPSSSGNALPCGPLRMMCMRNTQAQCINSQWQCVPTSSSSSTSSCMAQCPDGYTYPSCTESGHPIEYFADPCLHHYSSSSVMNSCGANTLLCRIGTGPVCVNGSWTCEAVTSSSPSTTSSVHITSLIPSSGKVRTRVTIVGSGFRRRWNIVQFGDSIIPFIPSADGTHLTFTVPTQTVRPCFQSRTRCYAAIRLYTPGTYGVSVRVNNDASNMLTFTVQ